MADESSAAEHSHAEDGEGVELSVDEFMGNDNRGGRHVALWEKRRKGGGGGNTLAFEAELRPADPTNNQDGASAVTFAPKTFCVALGLAYNGSSENNSSNCETDDMIESRPPQHAIPIGHGSLIISGSETLHGESIQIDLPLKGIDRAAATDTAVPLIVLDYSNHTKQKDGGEKQKVQGKLSNGQQQKQQAADASIKTKKKKSVVSLLRKKSFKKNNNSKTGKTTQDAAAISTLDQNQHNKAKQQHYTIQDDAVLRLQIEVFQRGSPLEEVFRQRNRLRRIARKKREAEAAKKKQQRQVEEVILNQNHNHEPLDSRTFSNTSKSLVDNEDSFSSCSTNSSSYLSLTDASQTTWDESTYLDDTITDMSTLNDNDTSLTPRHSQQELSHGKTSVFGRMFCKMDSDDAILHASPPLSPLGIFGCGGHDDGIALEDGQNQQQQQQPQVQSMGIATVVEKGEQLSGDGLDEGCEVEFRES